MNIEFLIVSQIVGLFIDWIFQWNWQSVNKSKWNKGDNYMLSLLAVSSHSFVYAILTSFITLKIINQMEHLSLVFWTLFITHMIIDTRVPVKYIMRFKGLTWEQIYDYQNFGFLHIGIDHRLHEITLLALALLI